MIKIAASRSQHGEDEFIASLIPDDCEKVFVDVGANDGFSWSNSYNFAQAGFRLLLVEPMPLYAARCALTHRDNPNVFVEPYAIAAEMGAATFYVNLDAATDQLAMRSSLLREVIPSNDVTEVMVPTAPLSFLLAKHNVPQHYAVLSIDAEGMDLHVLETADLDHRRPRVICVENGLDAAPIRTFLEAKDYRLATKLGEVNDIFVDDRPTRAAGRNCLWTRLVGRGA